MTLASTPDSAAAYSKVKSVYRVARIASNVSKLAGRSGWQACRYSAQFHQSRTNSRS